MRKDKTLLYCINITGLLCLSISIVANNSSLNRFFAKDNNRYGDLYDLARVELFKVPIPEGKAFDYYKQTIVDINAADIVFLGDSYFMVSYGHEPFPLLAANALQGKYFFAPMYSLVEILHAKQQAKSAKRFLILETCESNIIYLFNRKILQPIPTETSIFRKYKLLKNLFVRSEIHYQYVLRNSFFTRPLYDFLATIRFLVLQEISPLTPAYTTNPPWLFSAGEVEGFYYRYSDRDMETIINNILCIRKLLAERNFELVLMLIPEKYTIYHTLLNNDQYNNFLPRLYESLNEKGVRVVCPYQKFLQSSEYLYYQTDTHWNIKGINLALSMLLDELNR